MKKSFQKICLFFLTIIICNCNKKDDIGKENQSKFTLSEKFVDSTSIGHPKNNKLELLKYVNEIDDESYVLIKLSQKVDNHWKLTSKDTVNSSSLVKMSPEIKDYNSDNFNDLKFCTQIGANLANSINVIMIYSNKTDTLKKIGRGWNLTYSEKLKMFRGKYSASTTSATFYKVDNDSLMKAFEVNLSATNESVKEYNRKGMVIKTNETNMDTVNYKLPKVKHWLREWTIKNALN